MEDKKLIETDLEDTSGGIEPLNHLHQEQQLRARLNQAHPGNQHLIARLNQLRPRNPLPAPPIDSPEASNDD